MNFKQIQRRDALKAASAVLAILAALAMQPEPFVLRVDLLDLVLINGFFVVGFVVGWIAQRMWLRHKNWKP